MTDSTNPGPQSPAPAPAPATATDFAIREIAAKREAKKPSHVSEREWQRHRCAAGTMVLIRSHFKSIYLIPMAVLSLLCGIWMVFTDPGTAADPHGVSYKIGLVWILAFVFYMNIFIFEWSRTWTYVLLATILALVFLGFAVNGPGFPVWQKVRDVIGVSRFEFSAQSYFFFAIYFAFCATLSWLKTRLNYVVVEHNEMQMHRNALFGDRERVSLLNPRIEVRVPDMLEYFHPLYRAGQIIIHAPDRTIVLDNVLHIRAIERTLDHLTGTLSVQVEKPAT